MTNAEIEKLAYSNDEKFDSIFIPAVQRWRFGRTVRDAIVRKSNQKTLDETKEIVAEISKTPYTEINEHYIILRKSDFK